MRVTLCDLRNGIEDIYREVMSEQGNGEAPNSIVLSRVKSQKSREVEALAPQLVDIALTKLFNDVSTRKGARSKSDDGIDLFGGYRGIPRSVTIAIGMKKDTAKLSFAEADKWMSDHSLQLINDRHDEFRRLVNDCRPFQKSDQDTLEVAMERKRRSQQH